MSSPIQSPIPRCPRSIFCTIVLPDQRRLLEMISQLPAWERIVPNVAGSLFLLVLAYLFLRKLGFFPKHAFERIKLRKKDLDRQLKDTLYFEITIPKNSQATAFQVQQKIFKAFHAIYQDPVEGPHDFSSLFEFIYYFQKLWRRGKVKRSKQVFSICRYGLSTHISPLGSKSLLLTLRGLKGHFQCLSQC